MAIELTGRINEHGQIELDQPANLQPGTAVHVIIEPTDPDQAWFWSPAWQAGEHEADQDISTGRYQKFDSMDDLLNDLFDDEGDETSSKDPAFFV